MIEMNFRNYNFVIVYVWDTALSVEQGYRNKSQIWHFLIEFSQNWTNVDCDPWTYSKSQEVKVGLVRFVLNFRDQSMWWCSKWIVQELL